MSKGRYINLSHFVTPIGYIHFDITTGLLGAKQWPLSPLMCGNQSTCHVCLVNRLEGSIKKTPLPKYFNHLVYPY